MRTPVSLAGLLLASACAPQVPEVDCGAGVATIVIPRGAMERERTFSGAGGEGVWEGWRFRAEAALPSCQVTATPGDPVRVRVTFEDGLVVRDPEINVRFFVFGDGFDIDAEQLDDAQVMSRGTLPIEPDRTNVANPAGDGMLPIEGAGLGRANADGVAPLMWLAQTASLPQFEREGGEVLDELELRFAMPDSMADVGGVEIGTIVWSTIVRHDDRSWPIGR